MVGDEAFDGFPEVCAKGAITRTEYRPDPITGYLTGTGLTMKPP